MKRRARGEDDGFGKVVVQLEGERGHGGRAAHVELEFDQAVQEAFVRVDLGALAFDEEQGVEQRHVAVLDEVGEQHWTPRRFQA